MPHLLAKYVVPSGVVEVNVLAHRKS